MVETWKSNEQLIVQTMPETPTNKSILTFSIGFELMKSTIDQSMNGIPLGMKRSHNDTRKLQQTTKY